MTDSSSYEQKKKSVRITRAKAAQKRAETYLKTHGSASASGLVRDLKDVLNEVTTELEFGSAAGDSQYG